MDNKNGLKEIKEVLERIADNVKNSKKIIREWVAIVTPIGISVFSTILALYSLHMSYEVLKLVRIEKKPQFTHLIKYDRSKNKYSIYIKNESENRAKAVRIILFPKVYNSDTRETREGEKIDIPFKRDRIFYKNTGEQLSIGNLYKLSQIRRDSEELWKIEAIVIYFNMETEEFDSNFVSNIEVKEE